MTDGSRDVPGRRGPATERQAAIEAWDRVWAIALVLALMKLLIWFFLA